MGGTTVFDRLDGDQKKAVALRRNGAVSAGAGSGKTTVLAARYLDLVFTSGADVRSILCLTFTRKAQAEMQSRVWRELSSSADPRARAQVERFSEASISTIDSFCGSVLRSSAQDYGYAPDFQVDDEEAKRIAEEEALRFLLERREDEALSELFSRMTFERVWRELFAEAVYRFSHPAPRPEGDFSAMPALAKLALARAAAKTATELDDAIAAGLGALGLGTPHTAKGLASAALFRQLGATLPQGCLALAGSAGGMQKLLSATRELAGWNLSAFGKSGVEGELKKAAGEGKEAARRLGDLAKAASLEELSEKVLGLLSDFAEVYKTAKRARGVMGFRDAAVCAVDLLSRRTDIRAYYKRRYRYLMVDEFQDDDELQKELLYLLAEAEGSLAAGIPGPLDLAPDKLFFVGDGKQSIYRFRGADVSVFNRLGAELSQAAAASTPDGEGTPRLRTNYRSEPALVAFFNDLFSRVFGGASAAFEATHEEALARAARPGLEPSLRLLWKERQAPAEGTWRTRDEALAEGIARFIADSVAAGSLAVPDGTEGTRPAGYDDFAVLFRSTSKQYLLERFLRLHKVPYAAQSPRGLFVESPANDIYAALRLALLASDRTAYATVLRSPLAALSDDGFVRILASGKAAFDPGAEPLLSSDDVMRYRRASGIHAELGRRVDRESLSSLVSWLWFECGLRLAILRRPDAHPYLEHYDFLYALAARADGEGSSAAAFLSELEPLMGRPEKLDDLETQREAGSGVKLMSIHRSKGLEFPIVILPWIENTGRRDGPGEAFYVSEDAGLTLNLCPWDEPGATRANIFYDAAKELDAWKEAAETKRLFYVACTRAETHLVFAAVEPHARDNKGSSFLGLLTTCGGKPDEDGKLEGLPSEIVVETVPDLSGEDYGRLAGAGRRPRDPSPLAAAYGSAKPLERNYGRRLIPATLLGLAAPREMAREAAAPVAPQPPAPAAVVEEFDASPVDNLELPEGLFGTACHALIEEGLAGRPFVLPDALAGQVPEGAKETFQAEARRLALTFLDSAFRKGFDSMPRRASEKGLIVGLPEGFALSCRLDLVFESEEEIVVVDFKSNRTRVPGEYELQLAAYKTACRMLAPGKRVRAFLYWLRADRAEEVLREAGLEELLDLAKAAALVSQGEAVEEEDPSLL
jgi:ATP-dependent helicase/nuclease subunit A